MGYAPVTRAATSFCGWMMFGAPRSAVFPGLSQNSSYAITLAPMSSLFPTVGPSTSVIAPSLTDYHATGALVEGSTAGAVITSTTSGSVIVQMPPPLWHGGMAPHGIQAVFLSLGNSSETHGVLVGSEGGAAFESKVAHRLACALQSSNVPTTSTAQTLCSKCSSGMGPAAYDSESYGGWPVCDAKNQVALAAPGALEA